jgi:hypothetical protein
MGFIKTVAKIGFALALTYFAARGCADALNAKEIAPSELENNLKHTEIEYKADFQSPVYDVLERYRQEV